MILASIPPREEPWDVCVVGSGPVGLALAFECEKLGLDVLVLESGKKVVDALLTDSSRAEIVDQSRHAPMDIAVARAVGGTSWFWGGRCVAFDDIDFEPRPYIPDSIWPISHEDVKPYYPAAAEYLCCGDATFDRQGRYISDAGKLVRASRMERWSSESRLALFHAERLEQSKKIIICQNSTVVDLKFNDAGREVVGAVVAATQGPIVVKARRLILAAGGVETTRLLLAVQRGRPGAFGGIDGPLGRYYMGHLTGKIATISFNDPKAINDLDFELDSTGCYTRRRFALTSEGQQQNRVLNTVFWPDNPAFYDPRHRSGVLSAVFLALAVPFIGRQILPEAVRLIHTGPKPYSIKEHLRNVIVNGAFSVRDLANILIYRFISKPRKPGFLIRNRAGKYGLHFSAEQEANPVSRITLTDKIDQFGLPRVKIDLRFTQKDFDSVVRSHKVLDAELRRSGVAKLEFSFPEDQLSEKVDMQANDGFHQVGTTRMGSDPNSSVVDRNLRVHNVDNLYIASSSVFPSSGHANSTFLAAALAVRLAHHLASESCRNDVRQDMSSAPVKVL